MPVSIVGLIALLIVGVPFWMAMGLGTFVMLWPRRRRCRSR
jgi:hypothetical protein